MPRTRPGNCGIRGIHNGDPRAPIPRLEGGPPAGAAPTMTPCAFPLRHVSNAQADPARPYGDAERRILSADGLSRAKREITSWPDYAITPLIALSGLAGELGLGAILYKDESKRFGLDSFKALGGAYAVLRVLQRHLVDRYGVQALANDIIAGKHRERVANVTVAAATDGNHGRAVAWGARMFGCLCIIYLHAGVSARRELEIARYGAKIHRVPGGYDDSVRDCTADCREKGWHVVPDTSIGSDDWTVPSTVMQGYAVMMDEILEQLADAPPLSHVFVQGGVGGLAAAISGLLWERLGPDRPRVVVVEPARADCIFRSIEAGTPRRVPGVAESFMACLSAGEISPVAWEILKTAADDVVALPDEAAEECMRLLAAGVAGDPGIVAGESGCAATAGLISASLDDQIRNTLMLDPGSRILVIGSEGATDPETYERVVGQPTLQPG